jgi:uncharacterized protein (TIGR00369 family)
MKPLPRYRLCFVCGRDNLAGLDIQFYRDGEKVTCAWVPAEKHLGYRDRVHGGVSASLLDEAMGWTPTAKLRRLLYTVEISVKYRRAVPAGQLARVEAELIGEPSRMARAAGRILDAEGRVCVEATGSYFPLPEGKTEEVLRHLYLEGEDREVTRDDL